MSSILIPVLGFIFVFGLVVFIHELGHFAVAKWNDVEVEAFALGMGPAFFTYQPGETEYRLCILPLGGYVKMAGEELEDREEEDDNPRAFHNKSVWSRVSILVAGAACNLLLGYVLYIPFGMVYGEEITPPRVGYVPKTMEVRDESGDTTVVETPAYGKLEVGDRILALNGKKVDDFKSISIRNQLLGDQRREFLIERNGTQKVVRIDPVRTVDRRMNQPMYKVGISGYIDPEIDNVRSGSQADKAGVKSGYKVNRFGDTPIKTGTQFQIYAADHSGTYTIGFEGSNGEQVSLETRIPDDTDNYGSWIQDLGIVLTVERKYYGPSEILGFAWDRTLADINLMYKALVGLITQNLSPKSLAGPVGIVQMTGQMALIGFWPLIRFTALFSINLGVINLLPIPVLDGGHILLAIPELFTGKQLPDNVVDYANRFGFALLITLLLVVTFFDLERFRFFETVFNLFGI